MKKPAKPGTMYNAARKSLVAPSKKVKVKAIKRLPTKVPMKRGIYVNPKVKMSIRGSGLA